VQADVTDEASVKRMFEEAGPCDIVIANAGAADSAPLAKHHAGPVERHAGGQPDRGLPDLPRGAGPVARLGRLIAVASTAGLKGYAKVAPYAAAKHGVVGWCAVACAWNGAETRHGERDLPRLSGYADDRIRSR
jgi:3-hydroxybutyrate dehydrogenase